MPALVVVSVLSEVGCGIYICCERVGVIEQSLWFSFVLCVFCMVDKLFNILIFKMTSSCLEINYMTIIFNTEYFIMAM